MLRLLWSDRFAAWGRQRSPGFATADPSRNKAEVIPKSEDRLRLGGAEADFATNRVRAPDGTVTTLRRQTAAVLRALAARRGRNVSKAELFAEVWGDIAVTDDSLTQCVTEIRRALGSARGVLVTVARDGYRLEAEAALPEAGRGAAKGRPTESLEVYELHLRGVEAKHEFTQEGFAEAVPLFRRALALDPDFAQAMVALSITLMFQVDFVPEAEAKAMIDESYALAKRAVALAPDDPNGLLRLACLRVCDGRRDEAWSYAERAVALAPTNPDVLAVAAGCYFFADRGRAPLDWAERAVALNPGHPSWYNIWLAQAALFQGETDLALRAGGEAPEGSADITIAAAEALSGDAGEARRLFDRLRELTRFSNLSDWWWIGDLRADPAYAPWVKAAEIAGLPVTEAEADALAARQGPPRQ